MATNIPKIIHYCWFGRGDKPQDVLQYIESWKKYLPDYEIIEWNEDNSDLDSAPAYVTEAYQAKKYAFVSDYVRIKALYEYGGIYFDTDLEVLSRFDEYLEDTDLLLAFESKELLMTAFIACTRQHFFIEQFLDTYTDRHFILADGSYDTTPNTDIWSPLAAKYGVDLTSNTEQHPTDRIAVYPIEIFCGFDMDNNHESITPKTRTVHHMACSWADSKTRTRTAIIHAIQRILGYKKYDSFKAMIKKLR